MMMKVQAKICSKSFQVPSCYFDEHQEGFSRGLAIHNLKIWQTASITFYFLQDMNMKVSIEIILWTFKGTSLDRFLLVESLTQGSRSISDVELFVLLAIRRIADIVVNNLNISSGRGGGGTVR